MSRTLFNFAAWITPLWFGCMALLVRQDWIGGIALCLGVLWLFAYDRYMLTGTPPEPHIP